jgi:RES domain
VVEIVRQPCPERAKPQFYTLSEGTTLFRIYETEYCPKPTDFRYYGPMSRFDHHRGKPAHVGYEAQKCDASIDSERGILYVGLKFSCCLVEVFGGKPDAAYINDKRQFATLTVKKDLTLLDIRDTAAMLAGGNVATFTTAERSITQAWSRCFYQQTDIYNPVHGIIYRNAHNSEDAIAFYERASKLLALKKKYKLSDPELKKQIRKVGNDNNISFIFPGDRISSEIGDCSVISSSIFF